MQGSRNVDGTGRIVLLGSGETSSSGGRIFESLARRYPDPLRIAVLETPAGFELNAGAVAGRIVAYLITRLQNYAAEVRSLPARKKGSAFSPDDEAILMPLLDAEIIFLGPGSPSYAVRQLKGSLAWELAQARQREGATLVLASAGAIASGSQALPVYEIFKVGEEVHWKPGLGLLEPYGLNLTIVPHWNNNEGGDALDTSRCFMGQARFDELLSLLPGDSTVVGLDELTGLIMDLDARTCQVSGSGAVHVLRCGETWTYAHGSTFPITVLGAFHALEDAHAGITAAALQLLEERSVASDPAPDEAVLHLLESRNAARQAKDWAEADRLRRAITELGWQVTDSADGAQLSRARD